MIDEGMSSVKTNTAERQAVIRNLLNNVDVSTKDADTAFLIELIGGVFGLFGLGYIYAGLTNTGIFRLIAGIVSLGILYTLFVVCGSFVIIGPCFAPLIWIGQVAIAYFTANDLKLSMNAIKAGGAGMSTPGGYIESPTPMSSSSDNLFNTPTTPEPAPRSSSSDSLFTTPDTPSTPTTDDDDFNADDLTKKV